MTLPTLPAIVSGRVHHVRHRPTRYAFTHRHHQWLVDLDRGTVLPTWLRRVTDVHPGDHLGGATSWADLKGRVVALATAEGIPATEIVWVVMLAHARVLGHVFDPLTTYWLLAPEGDVRAAVLEVRNTYGGRHTYVIEPDRRGRTEVDKEFFVSPFNDTSGRYAVQLTLAADSVRTRVALSDDAGPLVTAATWGRPEAATTSLALRSLVTAPLMTQRVSALIRWHGIRLWARGLPVRTPREVRR